MLATAVAAARLRHQSVIEDVEGGTVQIGTAQYKAAIHISGIKLEHKADGSGFQRVQRITASIRKSLLRTAPPRDTILQLSLIHISEPTRRLMASRMPSSA